MTTTIPSPTKFKRMGLNPPTKTHKDYHLHLPDEQVHICQCCDEAFLSLSEADLLGLYQELRQYLRK